MKQKLRISRIYVPDLDKFCYRGYIFRFFNLIQWYPVVYEYDFNVCKDKLLRHLKETKEEVVLDFYAEDVK